MKRESPEYLKLSLAAAMTLGFMPGRFWRNARMTCVNLLLHYENGCSANCSYCGLSRDRIADERTFIHVPWPLESLDVIIERLNLSQIARRSCISMITHKRACEDTLSITRRLNKETSLPVSILLNPGITDKYYLEELKKAGAEKIGIAVDAATQYLFEKHRGRGVKGPHKWDAYWERFSEAIDVFGKNNVGSHFISGLGEREEDLVRCFQKIRDLGGVNHLFSFFPEQGSRLEKIEPPPLDVYRRIQIACDIIDKKMASFQDFRFDPETGKILDFGVSGEVLNDLIDSGEPFRTRGCKNSCGEVDCNRPFGNSYPGPNLRNYPFPTTREDIDLIRTQIFSTPLSEKAICFSVPNIKRYDSDSYTNRGNNTFLAFSITGNECELHCDHCRTVLLRNMISATTPEELYNKVSLVASRGTKGILVSGGCDKNGFLPLVPFAPILSELKKKYGIQIAIHSKLLDRPLAQALSTSGADCVMVDVVNEAVLQKVYHLEKKTFRDVLLTLDLLAEYKLPAAPHLILGLQNGAEDANEKDEFYLLENLKNRALKSLVIAFLMPLPKTPLAGAQPMPLSRVKLFFAQARRMFPNLPIHLGCARPSGVFQNKVELLALKNRFDGIAFPSEETIKLARKRKYTIIFEESCCSL
jgi:biotin synthase